MKTRTQIGDERVTVRPQVARPGGGAFSLIEVLVAMAIFAILAALVIPKFSMARDSARIASTKTQLKSIRKVLPFYKLHHRDIYPKLAALQADWSVLTMKTELDGAITTAGIFGPYLRRAPRNAFTKSSRVVAPGTATSEDGWEYDENTGVIAAVGFNEVTEAFEILVLVVAD